MPAHDEAPEVPTAPAPLVLVVADDLTHRAIVGRMVRSLGFPARSSASSAAALRFLRGHPREVALLLADLALRRMDGGELAERARDLDPRLRVVLMVAPGDPHVDDLLAGYHDEAFVSKPVRFAELAEVLHDQLGTPSSAPRDPRSMTTSAARARSRRSR